MAYRNGSPVRISDIGDAKDGVENDKTAAWYNDERSISLAIFKQPGTNTVEVAEAVRRLLPTFQKQLPASATLHVLYDRSVSIRDSVNDVRFTLLLTLALVVMVIFLFLRNLSATVIPSLALPFSIVGTFAVMYVLGYSLDNLSLMALTLSVGFVVDDAIVMLENIHRHIERGEPPLQAALNGSKEIGFTILSMTISLAAVFIPILFMGGVIGRLFREFAVTIGVAILVSGFVSLSLTPMLCSRFLKPEGEKKHSKLYQWSEKGFDTMVGFYARTLGPALRHPWTVLAGSAAVLVATGWLFVVIPKGFLPTEDQGLVFGFTEGAQGIGFPAMKEKQQQIAAIVRSDPDVANLLSSCGPRGSVSVGNSGIVLAQLKPRGERKRSADQIIQDLRPKLAKVPGIRAFLQVPPPIRLGGSLTKSQYQYTLQDSDTAELYKYAPILEQKMRGVAGLQDVTSDLQNQNPQIAIDINRDRAAVLGVSSQQIEDALYTAYGTRQISTIYAPNNEYQVIMELAPEFQGSAAAISMLYVRASSGQLVPLSSLASIHQNTGPLAVVHQGQLPAVSISFNLKPGVSLGDAVAAVDRLARQTLPATVQTSFQGTAQAFQSSVQGLGLLLVVAILVIYMVLGILYESFIHPITILTALPFAGFGALVTLLAFRLDLSIYGFVGIIMLVGLVKKNGIMMVDFAIEAQRAENVDGHEGDLRGVPRPLPPDHDDDDGRVDGHDPDRARRGRRGGVAAAPRSRRRRRPPVLPDADALRHARLLHRDGSPAAAPAPPSRPRREGRADGTPGARAGGGARARDRLLADVGRLTSRRPGSGSAASSSRRYGPGRWPSAGGGRRCRGSRAEARPGSRR